LSGEIRISATTAPRATAQRAAIAWDWRFALASMATGRARAAAMRRRGDLVLPPIKFFEMYIYTSNKLALAVASIGDYDN
jgi:hypothetical protein